MQVVFNLNTYLNLRCIMLHNDHTHFKPEIPSDFYGGLTSFE